jgi:hypothetical protein
MMRRLPFAFVGTAFAMVLAMGSPAFAAPSDDEVRESVVRESRARYSGNCPCPYNADRAGRACGGRSAWSRRGGETPICYANEVTDEQIKAWRARNKS